MAQFGPAYDFLMESEDSQRRCTVVADPVPQRPNPADNAAIAADNLLRESAQAISGINSYSFPQDFARIASLPQAARGYAVQQFYQAQFWTPLLLAQLTNQVVADFVGDAAVNEGAGAAVKLFQEAINDCWTAMAQTEPVYLDEDGAMGPLTIAGANSCNPNSLLLAFETRRITAYERIGGPDVAAWTARAQRWRPLVPANSQ